MAKLASICVYLGSSSGNGDFYLNHARDVGQKLAQRDIRVIYGGGQIGCMGALAEGAMQAGGEVIGVIPEMLSGAEIKKTDITKLHVVKDIHARKAKMAELSDGFLVLPGSIGTLEEMFEAWTWHHLNIHRKPLGLINLNGYFNHLITFMDKVFEVGFMAKDNRDHVQAGPDVETVLTKMLAYSKGPHCTMRSF